MKRETSEIEQDRIDQDKPSFNIIFPTAECAEYAECEGLEECVKETQGGADSHKAGCLKLVMHMQTCLSWELWWCCRARQSISGDDAIDGGT